MTVVDIKAYQGISKGINGSKCRYQRESKEVRTRALTRSRSGASAERVTASESYLSVMEACIQSMEHAEPRLRAAEVIDFMRARSRRLALDAATR